ncbi:COX15/CtaA family protein [Cesiribacter sp. SM1]|uniref:COX15/CtaA family protein n=1 Tax=Cesiribacter sp. SM1 TaxID=2861196 RepID=UPI001CD4A827|nr:COX15/CtaA family protein [Cesiribacter sp. SM1]
MQSYTQPKLLKTWLWSGIILVTLMVVIGGITRLTGSGLSMVEWKPVTGIVPPMNEQQWQQAFNDYKQYPEYQKINFSLTLEDFKGIFWWEYTHRLLGRLTGLIFLVPFLYFLLSKQLAPPLVKRLLLILLLGALQGMMGWLMVKSGLADIPHVSHYRLAAHLSLALLLIAVLLWTIQDLGPARPLPTTAVPRLRQFQLAKVLVLLVFCQIVLGAFVAGLKAGFSYNTFPLMEEQFFPHNLYNSAIDLFESGPVVQFIHRWFAFLVLGFALLFVNSNRQAGVPASLKQSVRWLLLVLFLQTALGISTLLLRVPLVLGVLHQLVAVLLFSLSIKILYQASSTRRSAATTTLPLA